MKKLFNLFNLLLTGLVFWIGNEYFNEYISIINTKTLIISALLMFGISYLFRYLMLASVLTIPICIGCQKQRGERINKNCDYIQNRDIRIYGLEQQKLILKWVLEEDNN